MANRAGESKLSVRRIEAQNKQHQALELRMAGRTWQEIADHLGYAGHTGAYEAVKVALSRSNHEAVQDYRNLTLGRLTKILQVHWPLMLQADPVASKLCLQTIKDMRELMGLDSPVRMEHTGADGAPIRHEVITLDIGDITEAITVLRDAGAVRLESNGHSPATVDTLYPA
tara:strand:+ start:272 stop:784 length:513 start_codon:yes stop_codon:yes gene_type:complete